MAFSSALKEADIVNFYFHDLRHTFASCLRQRGVDLHSISTLLGHKDMRKTQRYAHLSDTSECPHVFHENGKKLYDRKVQRAFRKTVKEAEIADFSFHDLRHCFGSYLRQNGVELDIIAELMNHKDLRMTRRYAHLNVEALRGPVKQLDEALLRFYDADNNGEGITVATP